MESIVECVPNFSEGKDKAVIQAIAAAITSVENVQLLNIDPGVDFNRTVYTFVGEPEAVLEAAFQAAKIGTALIDMQCHTGEHARMGALDVIPFIPIKGVTDKDCIELSERFGKRMADELNIPVFLYAKSAKKPERVLLPNIRKGEYEALEDKFKDPDFKPDFGKAEFNPKSGATATGCRDILIAYNINLNTADKNIASDISGCIRTSGTFKKDREGNIINGPDGKPQRIPGRFKGVQASGMMYDENIAQVSMNLLNYKEVNLHDVFETVKEEAEKHHVEVTGSEIVGLVPKDSIILAGKFYAENQKQIINDENTLLMLGVEKLGLSDLYPFNPKEKVIEYMIEKDNTLVSLSITSFLLELASSSPAPGGGSVAALSGALGSALSSMVCNLTIGKDKYKDVQQELIGTLYTSEKLLKELTYLIDEDSKVFNDLMRAFKLPKETDTEKKNRWYTIQEGYKKAALVPIKTARLCISVIDVALVVAHKGNPNSITDAGVSAIMAKAGVESAVFNIKINLGSIEDQTFVETTLTEIEDFLVKAENKTAEILKIVETKL